MNEQIKTFSGHSRELVENDANKWVKNNRVNVLKFDFKDNSDSLENFYEIIITYRANR